MSTPKKTAPAKTAAKRQRAPVKRKPPETSRQSEQPLSDKQRAFVQEYLVDLNATQAAIRAGYSAKTAEQQGPRLLGNVGVKAAIDAAQAERSKRVEASADDVLREWLTIATADPRELVRYRVRACRYCHGVNHQYQWVSRLEFEDAVRRTKIEAAKSDKPVVLPDSAGGFGYSTSLRPVASCHFCLGDGVTDVMLPDTRDISPQAARLYAGVKQTKEGIEVRMRDQDAALLNVAKHLGMLKERVALGGDAGAPPIKTETNVTMTPAEAYMRMIGKA